MIVGVERAAIPSGRGCKGEFADDENSCIHEQRRSNRAIHHCNAIITPTYCTQRDPYARYSNGRVSWRTRRERFSESYERRHKFSRGNNTASDAATENREVATDDDEIDDEIIAGSFVNLPLEIWDKIFWFVCQEPVEFDPSLLRSCDFENNINLMLIAPWLTDVAARHVYRYPKLFSQNYLAFHDAVWHHSDLARYTEILDLSMVSKIARNSMTSRIIRKSSASLRKFIAPQCGLGLNSLRALSLCRNLEVCDLSYVSERVNLTDFFDAISGLSQLEAVAFPRCSLEANRSIPRFPRLLSRLALAGGMTDEMIMAQKLPQSVHALRVSFCPLLSDAGLAHLLQSSGEQLTSLEVRYPMPNLSRTALDDVFKLCPNLKHASLSVEYFSDRMLHNLSEPLDNLESLEMHYSGQLLVGASKVTADDISELLIENRLPCLRNVKVSIRFWKREGSDVRDFIDLIEDQGGRFSFIAY